MHLLLAVISGVALLFFSTGLNAQNASAPRVELKSAPPLRLSGDVDSNSPAIWDRVAGRNLIFVMTSMWGRPHTAWERDLQFLGAPRAVVLDPWPDGGIWMEAVIKDVDGTWYGYYHNEVPAAMCAGSGKVIPRIGAVRSHDHGLTWEPLGLILEAPPRTYDCATNNSYFVGGLGDFSVQLDPESRDLYFFYSLYLRAPSQQGVAVARLAWADRDAPTGQIMIWRSRTWVPATDVVVGGAERWIYPAGVPIFPAAESWHDDDTVVDAYWGPSVHWNTHVQQYVMLLNRAKDANYGQEGIYVSFTPSLNDPRLWSTPGRILKGGDWYPQVIGLDGGSGTDKNAGEWARFFMSGISQHFIHFIR